MAKRVFTGSIISDKMQKTAVVAVEMPKKHPLYNKEIKNTVKFKARNEIAAKTGDVVLIEECAPLSRHVFWIIKEVIKGN